jgi:acetyl-CoA acyltransferase
MTDAFIVSAVRTPVGKAPNGSLSTTRPDELAANLDDAVANLIDEVC